VIRRRGADGVNFFVLQQLADIGIGLDFLVFLLEVFGALARTLSSTSHSATMRNTGNERKR